MKKLLGDYVFKKYTFANIEGLLAKFKEKKFSSLPDREKSDQVNRALLEVIQKEKEPCFLLSAVLDYVKKIDEEDILLHYRFNSFEIWLNQFSGLSFEQNYAIRSKVVGKKIPRDAYQALFPIGMGKVYEGSHFVTAHKSPDLDTTIASFWGWLDAFGARVGDSLHQWNVPGGPPESYIEMKLLFEDFFGKGVFTHLVKTRTALSLTGNDLFTQQNLIKKMPHDSTLINDPERNKSAVIITDQEGFYLGDWRTIDVQGVRQLITMLNAILGWFENHIHLDLITLFSKKDLSIHDIPKFVEQLFGKKIQDCESILEYTDFQKEHFHKFLFEVLGIKKGVKATFKELGKGLSDFKIVDIDQVSEIIPSIKQAKIFDAKGVLIEDRPKIFFYLEKFIKGLHAVLAKVRSFTDQIEMALSIKTKVLGFRPQFVTVRADVEEMRNKMQGHQYLTVNYPDQGKFYPVGIIRDEDLRKKTLGTVSLRDFCNRDEMTIPNYLEIISVIDHHKSALNTYTAPMAIISDAQSSNCLVAEIAFQINDRYTTYGKNFKELTAEIDHLEKKSINSRLFQRLIQRQFVADKNKGLYIHPEREIAEYLHFLYGILDDTDLLMKVSARDVECVAELLNRLKSLITGKETEIIDLSDLAKDADFGKNAALRILQNDDMYSLYKKVFQYREKEIEKNIDLASQGKPSTFFSDTKEQNQCCRVGQTKMFAKNRASFEKNGRIICKEWQKKAEAIHKGNSDIDLHLHMISTIVGADEVYQGKDHKHFKHQDELWIWAAPTEIGTEHLKRFLNAIRNSPQMQDNHVEVELCGENADELANIFSESFNPDVVVKKIAKKIPVVVIKYNAGTINSRKAMISPYLPSLVNE